MADSDRPVLVQQEHRHRFADNVAAPDHDAFLAAHFDLRRTQQFHHPCRCAGQEFVVANHDFPDILRMERVHILFRGNGRNHSLFIKMPGQRKLNQDTVNVRLSVELVH